MRRLRRGARLVAIWACVMGVHAALRCLGYHRVQRGLTAVVPRRRAAPGEAAEVAETLRLAMRTLKRRLPEPWAGNCLSRSVTLWWLLARRGVPTTLHIGARRHDGDFRAHAWVEHAGRPLNAKRRIREKYRAFDHTFAEAPDA